MKQKLIIILVLLINFTYKAQQNLVPNGSFELYDTCPNSQAQLRYCIHWFDPTGTSSDYFNRCAVLTQVAIPQNFAGDINPFDGNSYCGFLAYYPSKANCREYIAVSLGANLNNNQSYTFTAYFALAKNSMFSVNNLGVVVLDDTLGLRSYFENNINIQPDAFCNITLSDTSWNKITLTFSPKLTGKYLVIGNFFNDLSTTKDNSNSLGSINGAYYFIDEVSLTTTNDNNSMINGNLIVPEVITPNGDGHNDFLEIKNIAPYTRIEIYNRWGNQVFISNDYQNDWNGGRLPSGTYYVIVNCQNNYSNKSFLQILK
ncbi:MAG: gliding motility-associated C-terminal domain-containing protein [Bacteroidetes bacterium]|jgi:gliding motility-associated-like protein|nr:gliding motility-associated C-terminal domain-containing protein [Bacteroidota bacterium]MCA6443845.1 gliding motility-associated C-terminal domain-containing protein [Bacteroidota bacterium]